MAGLTALLFIALFVLKLTHVIAVSWWVVASPIWMALIAGAVTFVVALVVSTIADELPTYLIALVVGFTTYVTLAALVISSVM